MVDLELMVMLGHLVEGIAIFGMGFIKPDGVIRIVLLGYLLLSLEVMDNAM